MYVVYANIVQNIVWTPSKLIARLGREIDNPESVYYWCYKVHFDAVVCIVFFIIIHKIIITGSYVCRACKALVSKLLRGRF